ncbi:hypothetical protein EVAR_103459_1 [Eumeta japonica]|uniref:Uncharacterized protein n=1 Tax=Eumeta variegata TaxID=151549 RepID=A0A4C1YZP9_EUMVA|nr:hypothetical protein EVAR_103459_1 [Eumeta japonica]
MRVDFNRIDSNFASSSSSIRSPGCGSPTPTSAGFYFVTVGVEISANEQQRVTSGRKSNIKVATYMLRYIPAKLTHRCTAIPACGSRRVLRARRVPRASSRFAAYRTAPAPPRPSISFYHDPARAPRGRRVAPSAVLRERSTSAEHSCGHRNG